MHPVLLRRALLQKFSIVVLDTAIMHEKKCSRVVFLAL